MGQDVSEWVGERGYISVMIAMRIVPGAALLMLSIAPSLHLFLCISLLHSLYIIGGYCLSLVLWDKMPAFTGRLISKPTNNTSLHNGLTGDDISLHRCLLLADHSTWLQLWSWHETLNQAVKLFSVHLCALNQDIISTTPCVSFWSVCTGDVKYPGSDM